MAAPIASAVRKPGHLVVRRHRDQRDLATAGGVDELQRHLDAVAVGLVEDQLAAAVERVVGVERARHRRIGDLLHADDDVHGTPLGGHAGTTEAPTQPVILASSRPDKSKRGPGLPSSGADGRRSSTSWWSGPGRAGSRPRSRRRHAAARWCASTRRASRATRPAATASPPARSRALEALGLTYGEFAAIDAAIVRETVLVSPSGRRVTLPLPTDGLHAAVVARRDLDAALVALARRRGVDVREQCAVEKLAVHDDEIEVLARRRIARSRAHHVIAADGHWSTVRRALEPDAPRDLGEWHAARQYFADVDDDRLWVLFERDLLPGYAWVFPLPGGRRQRRLRRAPRRRANGSRAQGAVARAPRATDRCATSSARAPRRPSRCAPGRSRRATTPTRLAHGRVLFVGDAAGVVDPLTGEGIAQAIETRRARGRGDRARRRTGRRGGALPPVGRPRARTRPALRVDAADAAALRRSAPGPRSPPPASRPGRAATSPAGCSRTIRGRSLATPDRWRRGAFSAPGAYRVQ